jgi:hypothetical protein
VADDIITLNNGVELPVIGLGVFQTPPAETRAAVAAALDTGKRGGPDPTDVTLETFGRPIPEG